MAFRQIDIIGNGAIGNVLAYHLQTVDHIKHLARHVRTAAASRFITLDGVEHSLHTKLNVWASAGSPHLVIVPVKSYQVLPALKQFKQHFSADTSLLLLHNGMLDPALLREYEDQHRVFLATTSIGAIKATPTTCQQTGSGLTLIGSRQQVPKAQQQAIVQLLSTGFGTVKWTSDIQQTLWDKLTVNAIINPLTALHNLPNGALLKPEWRETIAQLADEINKIMGAEGLKTTYATIIERVNTIAMLTQRNYSSMHQDVLHGRETEIEEINGYLVRRARALGLACPCNAQLLAQVRALKKPA